jgi:MOSC domain-containing protein YiiM
MLETLDLAPGDLRENITVQGVSIDSLQPDTLLQSGEVILKIVDICDPCKKLEDIRPGLMQAAVGMRGMLAVVIRGGQLNNAAPVMIVQEQ